MSGWREATIQQAISLEEARAYGSALGLSRPESEEILAAWTDWYQATGLAIDYHAIRNQMTERALGEPWQPPSEEATALAARLAAASRGSIPQAVGVLRSLGVA